MEPRAFAESPGMFCALTHAYTKFGCMGVDTKFVQPQVEVDQDLGNWVFGSSPYLAHRNQKFAACQKKILWVFGASKLWVFEVLGLLHCGYSPIFIEGLQCAGILISLR
jgi:hypothetical protein